MENVKKDALIGYNHDAFRPYATYEVIGEEGSLPGFCPRILRVVLE